LAAAPRRCGLIGVCQTLRIGSVPAVLALDAFLLGQICGERNAEYE
jgi:hypothetical protein